MTALFVVGRVFYGAVFVVVPIGVIQSSAMIANAPPLRRVPMPRIAVPALSALAVLGALMVAFGVWPDLGAILIGLFLVPVTVVMHRFWGLDDGKRARSERDAFLVNVSILGGAIVLFWYVNRTQSVPGGLVSMPLFGRW